LQEKISLHDTCGALNFHDVPGLIEALSWQKLFQEVEETLAINIAEYLSKLEILRLSLAGNLQELLFP